MSYMPAELIKKKKLKGEHSREEIIWIVKAFTAGELPDYQMSAWAMAIWFNGMTDTEIAVLTEAMRDSGKKFSFSHLERPRIDKHSTGGVGDKTTLIIGPILAAAKVHVPMIAGRGLGHTGGTLDKLASIPGFRLSLSSQEFQENVEKHFFSLIAQTEDICPADRKFYALRDVTATIDSLPLICGSIMSKKLAEDLTGLVLDVKFGSGAFMKTIGEAERLAQLLKNTGEKNGVRVSALITNMNEPLGRFIGNSLEVQECVDILSGKKYLERGIDFYENTRQLSLALSAQMLILANRAANADEGFKLAEEILNSGAALKEFQNLILRQGPGDLLKLPRAKNSTTVTAPRSGFLHKINTELIGLAGVELGAGRKISSDKIDSTAGIEVLCRLNMKLEKNQPIFRLLGNDERRFADAEKLLLSAIEINDAPPQDLLPLIAKVLT